jgi:hypothetical protein
LLVGIELVGHVIVLVVREVGGVHLLRHVLVLAKTGGLAMGSVLSILVTALVSTGRGDGR